MALRYNSETGEYEESNDQATEYPVNPDNGYTAGGQADVAAQQQSSTPDYASQITQQYQTSLGRAPTAEELASDTANAQKYGTGGSLLADIAARASNTPGEDDRQLMVGGGTPPPATSPATVSAPNTGVAGPPTTQSSYTAPKQPEYANDQYMQQLMDYMDSQDTQNKERSDDLFKLWSDRASQSLALDRNDPVIRAQADAFSANQDRSARNYISDMAERSGPYSNLEGTRRMAAEHAGQASGQYEAGLMGQELAARRKEISDALNGMSGQLSAEQTRTLQERLGLLDQAIKQQGIGLGQDTLSQDWQKELLHNEQFNNQLGLTAQQLQAYYDLQWGK